MGIERKKKFLINIAYWGVILIVVYVIFKYCIELFLPFIIALLFSAIVRPLVELLNRKLRIKKAAAAVFCCLLLYAVLLALLLLVGFRIVAAVANVFSMLPSVYRQSIEPALWDLFAYAQDLAAKYDLTIQLDIDRLIPQLLQSAGEAVSRFSVSAVSFISGYITRLPRAILSFVITVVATFLMSVDYDKMMLFMTTHLPSNAKKTFNAIRVSLGRTFALYGKSYSILMLITFVELLVGLLALRIEKAMMLAMVIAVLDIFPILGTGMVLGPWAFIMFIQGDIFRAVGLITLYLIITVVRQIIEPRIVGKQIGLNPIVTLISMFVGGGLFGFAGFFGLPLSIAIIQNLQSNGAIKIFGAPDEEEGEEEAAPEGDEN